MDPRSEAGVKMPSERSEAMRSRHAARSQGVNPHASSGVSVAGWSGGGCVGNGWVGESSSPGTSVGGTGRSSTGKSGSPVSRSSRKRWPIFVACARAATGSPEAGTNSKAVGWGATS